MPRFPLVELTDLCDVLSGGTPSTKKAEYWNGGIPWASVKDFNTDSRWFTTTEKNISQEGLENCSSVLLEPGELILSARGTVGVVAQTGIQTAFNQSNYGLRAKSQVCENNYLYYALVNSKRALLGDAHGGMFDTITRATLGRLLVPCPPLREQKRIAQILGVFDEKIAVNHDLAKTLEAFAESLFRSWFIDFDPVKAKMAAQEPVGMDAETAALFPDSMEDSGLGEVPAGWSVSSLADIVSVTKGKSYKSSELNDSPVSLVTLKSFLRGGGYREDGLKPYSGTFKAEQVVQPGEIVMAFTDVTQAADLIGVPAIVGADPSAEQLVASLDVGIVRPSSASLPSLFIYFLLKSERFREHAKAHASGTTVLHLSKDAVPNFETPMPPDELLTKFREIAEPALALAGSLSQESRLLASVRDGLLTRLVSGELEIPDEMLAA